MAALTITAEDFAATGPKPAAGTWFRFRRFRLDADAPKLGSNAAWKVQLDAQGAAVTELPAPSLTNALVLTSNLRGFRQTIVAGYPEGNLTLTELLGYAVDPVSVKVSKLTTTAWQLATDALYAAGAQLTTAAANSALDADMAAAAAASSADASKAAADDTAAKLGGYVPANPALVVTYNPDGSVATLTENGVLSEFTYNPDGTVKTQKRAGITKTFTYDANGNVTGAA